jgi:hypothetical protein
MASSASTLFRAARGSALPSRSRHSWAERATADAARLAFCVFLFCFVLIAAALAAFAPAAAAPHGHQPARVDVTADLSGGFARLVFAFHEQVGASVHSAGNILIIISTGPFISWSSISPPKHPNISPRRGGIPMDALSVSTSHAAGDPRNRRRFDKHSTPPACALIRRQRHLSRCFSPTRATRFRPSTRSPCFTIFAS